VAVLELQNGGLKPALRGLPPLSVYVHVPWCVRKCPYCDFNSHAWQGELPEAAYLAALQADLEQALPDVWGRQVSTVFIGGGTPSLLSPRALDALLTLLRTHLPIWPDAEITLEANPGTAEAGKFAAYAASGVNRLSLGIQSFDDRALQALGRIHDARQARAAIELAQRAVARVNLDLMFALPGQSLQACEADLREAMAFGTEHLSLYNLTLEPNTVFAKYPPAGLPDDDLAALMQERIETLAGAGGWRRYEVSAYARSAHARCRHTLNYWEFGDYLGLGPGAHGKLSFPDRIVRQARLRQPESWMEKAALRDGSHLAESRAVAAHDLPFEFMMNALRLREGVPARTFTERTGLPAQAAAAAIARCVDKGLLEDNVLQLRATDLGWRFLNDTLEAFLDEKS
jgi:oxygen-independent coproporphyrinogen-3 oxidase